jgi:hypothetical protein
MTDEMVVELARSSNSSLFSLFSPTMLASHVVKQRVVGAGQTQLCISHPQV